MSCQSSNFLEFERKLVVKVFVLGQLFISLFLSMRKEGIRERHQKPGGYKWQKQQDRLLGTFFGKVRYWRSYVYQTKGGGGYYPLDVELGLTGDGFSILVQSYAALIVTGRTKWLRNGQKGWRQKELKRDPCGSLFSYSTK